MFPWQKICCPVDFSEPSREAMRTSAELTRRFDAELTLLHVYQVPGYAFPEGFVLAGPEVLRDLVAHIEETLAAWRMEAEGIVPEKVSVEVVMGVPFAEIVRFTRQGHYDLIVMGTHGRGGLRHVLLGSVAEKVVRKASCPVLTIRLPAQVFVAP